MIYPSFYPRQRDCLFQLKRCAILPRDGDNPATKQHCYNRVKDCSQNGFTFALAN
jgi:hypothetical protein